MHRSASRLADTSTVGVCVQIPALLGAAVGRWRLCSSTADYPTTLPVAATQFVLHVQWCRSSKCSCCCDSLNAVQCISFSAAAGCVLPGWLYLVCIRASCCSGCRMHDAAWCGMPQPQALTHSYFVLAYAHSIARLLLVLSVQTWYTNGACGVYAPAM